MTETCPICNTDYRDAAENIAARKLAEHIREKAKVDDDHAEWLDEHTEDGTDEEIVETLR